MTHRGALGVLCAVALLAPPAAAAAPSFTDGNGLHVTATRQFGSRDFGVKVDSRELGRPVDVRILLPAGYDDQPSRRWPVLYLFHGTSGRASDWVMMGAAEKTTAKSPFIVVMPDAGFNGDGGGWFTDAYNDGKGGVPMWETFHIKHVIPWVDATLRTIPERRGRAIYGLSQGGFGALSYAARHPDMFVAAGSFSGAVDTTADSDAQLLVTPIIQATAVGLNGTGPDVMFGPRSTQQVNWAAHDPATLVENLRGMDLRLYTGNGSAGPFDPPVPNPGSAAIEAGVHRLTELFQMRAASAGIITSYHDYGAGTHSWGYWTRDLQQVEPALTEVFADPPAAPARITYGSGDGTWSAWGWDVKIDRPAREFSTLSSAAADGFALSGSGTGRVRTPPVYLPGSTATVVLKGDGIDRSSSLVADANGRLALDVPLGPGNPDQQYTPEAAMSGTKVFTTKVTINGVLRPATCASRALTLRLRIPRGASVGRVRATLDGRRIAARRRGGSVTVTLGELTAGPHRVRVAGRARLAHRPRSVTLRAQRTVRC
jgi:S-formylglutathione hydrolase FrmB